MASLGALSNDLRCHTCNRLWHAGTFDGRKCLCGRSAAYQSRKTFVEWLLLSLGIWKRFDMTDVYAINMALGGEVGAHRRNIGAKLKES